MKRPKDFRWLAVSLLVLVLILTWGAARVGAAQVTPTVVPDNLTCATLVPGSVELKVEPVTNGTYSDGTLSVTLAVRDTAAGPVFDFTANLAIEAVLVKGGP